MYRQPGYAAKLIDWLPERIKPHQTGEGGIWTRVERCPTANISMGIIKVSQVDIGSMPTVHLILVTGEPVLLLPACK